MVGLKNWLKSSRILQFLSKLVLQNNLIAHYCFFKQITEMSICHCLSVKKRVSVKNVKILEMSDFGNTGIMEYLGFEGIEAQSVNTVTAHAGNAKTPRRTYPPRFTNSIR